MKRARLFAVRIAAGALCFQAAVADTASMRVHGVVKSFDGEYLTLTADSGKSVILALQPATRIVHSRMLTLADVKPGFFVGTLAMRAADGVLHAQSVRVFPPASQGAGEGQYPMDTNPSRIVTNASVSAVTMNPSGGMLSLSFRGARVGPDCSGHAPVGSGGCAGTADLLVARGVPILTITSGDPSLLMQGAVVTAFVTTDAASLFTATSITVEKDGKPPKAIAQ